MKTSKRISIVTPSLNQGRFLQSCIDSIRSQNWSEIEHIIVDGGSTDETLEVIQRNASWFTACIIEPDRGAADAINKGFKHCSGDIIAWLNADDFYLPGTFLKIDEAVRARPDASFWFGNGFRADESGNETSIFSKTPVIFNREALRRGLDYVLQPATFLNPKVLHQVGGLDRTLKWSFDWDLWIRMADISDPVAIDSLLAASREWGQTLTSSGGLLRAEEIRMMAERHSGEVLTPGALRYWLYTLSQELEARGQWDLLRFTRNLWRSSWPDIRGLGVSDEGFPLLSQPRAGSKYLRDDVDVFSNSLEHSSQRCKQGSMKSSNLLESSKTIAVDLWPLIAGVSGGIVPWVQGVLREMCRLYPDDRLVMYHRPGKPPLEIEAENVEFVALEESFIPFYEAMGRECVVVGADVVVRTYPQEHHPTFPLTKQIFIIPDIQHEFFPEFFTEEVLALRRRAFSHALTSGGAIATMTEHSRSTIVESPWTLTSDVFLMPAALAEELQTKPDEGDLPQEVAKFDSFFYMPANLWKHKNHRRLFEAFRRALPELPTNTGLVLTGNPAGYGDFIKGYEDLPIVHLGFVPHKQVAALLRNADAMVYFSLFEGFGMPLLEAFYQHTPVLCSNTTALPEVGGDAVLACDPNDETAMASLMVRIIREPGLRDRLIENGLRRLKVYDWKGPARELRAAVSRVSRNPVDRDIRSPLVSIVMPTRNHEQFIRQSIDSVLCQTYPNIELLVVDGASTDGTVNILKSYENRIRYISEPDHGQSDAINKGLLRLSGEILTYLNSDDLLRPDAIDTVVRFFNDHPECDMVYGDADYIDAEGNVSGKYNTAEYTFERLMEDCCVCQPAAFWRRRIAERIGPLDPSMQTAMDYEYWLRMGKSGAVIQYLRKTLAQSRLHDDAKTLTMRNAIYSEVFTICDKHGGYVSQSYYRGLWSYRLYESWRGGKVLRKLFPTLYLAPALVHFAIPLATKTVGRRKIDYINQTLANAEGTWSQLVRMGLKRMMTGINKAATIHRKS